MPTTTTNPPIFDGHNDSLQAIYLPKHAPRDFLKKNDEGHIDLQRAERGGFNGGLFAIFVPALLPENNEPNAQEENPVNPSVLKPVDFSYARALTQKGIESLFNLESSSRSKLRVIRDMRGLENTLKEKAIAAVMHFEGAETIDPKLKNLEGYYNAGLRSLGLVWSRPNAFGYGVEHVALGSDFDGATIPKELGDVSGLPKLISALRESGFNEEDLARIAYKNWLRILANTWK